MHPKAHHKPSNCASKPPQHRSIEIVPGDVIIISATPIPGNEKLVSKVINDTVEFEEEDAADAAAEDAQPQEVSDDEEEEYFCPECGAKISLDMSHCPKCGVELVFEEE